MRQLNLDKSGRHRRIYTVFGKVDDEDMGVLDKIAAAGTVDGSLDGQPKTDVVITSAQLD
jgi:peptidyl-prolyl cis-trans isomerase B (cyclophilin B)